MPPLRVQTDGMGKASLELYADAIMFRTSPKGGDIYDLLGMSIIAPEQAIRAVAAGCALEDPEKRTIITFTSSRGRQVRCRWAWSWRVLQALQLMQGSMHMVAVADRHGIIEQLKGRVEKVVGYQTLVIPPGQTEADLEAAVYDVLLQYSTPLIPCDRPGQPEWEQRAGLVWRREVVAGVLENPSMWARVMPHPEQPDRRWSMAGVLTITDASLDAVVSRLVRNGHIKIPNPPVRMKGAA